MSRKRRPSGITYGIYYPDFYFLDEIIFLNKKDMIYSLEEQISRHRKMIICLVLFNDVVKIPMDNFIFSINDYLVTVRERFLTDKDVKFLIDNKFIMTSTHNDLDMQATLELYRYRLRSSGFQLSELTTRVDDSLILSISSEQSLIDSQINAFKNEMRAIIIALSVRTRASAVILDEIVKRSYEIYGENDISAEYISEMVEKSSIDIVLKDKILPHIRRAFYKSFAPNEGLKWYSDIIGPSDLILDRKNETFIPYLYSPDFIEKWLANYLSLDEWQIILAKPTLLLIELMKGSFFDAWLSFKEYYHEVLVPELDLKIRQIYRSSGNLNPNFTEPTFSSTVIQDTAFASAAYTIPPFRIVEPLIRPYVVYIMKSEKMNNLTHNILRPRVKYFIEMLRVSIRNIQNK